MKKLTILLSLLAFFILNSVGRAQQTTMATVFENSNQWTGVAVSSEGRIFVNFPRWKPNLPLSVAELLPDGSLSVFPDKTWNTVNLEASPTTQFICVQSVVIDDNNYLWVLDAANPVFQGVIRDGPKLLQIDIKTRTVVNNYPITHPTTMPYSYLNDVRIDTKNNRAYITDSGAGGIIVLDLESGESRAVIRDHKSTRSEHIKVQIGDIPWVGGKDNTSPDIHIDGIAYDSADDYLYYKALTGKTLYRIKASYLRNPELSDSNVAKHIEKMGKVGVCDGLLFANGKLYISEIEESAIKTFTPSDGLSTLIQSDQLEWPDSFAKGPDGFIYVTTSRIHLRPDPENPYKIFRFKE